MTRLGHRGGIAPDVQRAIDAARRKPQSERIVVLGDSVARQLFSHNSEPSADVRYLTTNQAVTMAGQYYLARDAMERSVSLKDLYLILLPAALENNMSRPYTTDYFCGHFHTWPQVVEVFTVKRDIELSAAHLGRCLLPNLLAANSLSHPATAMDARPAGTAQSGEAFPPADPERWLTELSTCLGPATSAVPHTPSGQRAAHLSPTSEYFLRKLRNDCQRRGVRLHVLPSPVSSEANGFEYVDPLSVYDGPIINDIPANQLIDNMHFKTAFIAGARKRFIEFYGLDFAKRAK